MARNTNKKKAGRAKQLWDKSNTSARVKWHSTSQKGYDFYLDEQLTKHERESLEDAGMPTFTINRVTPIVETMKYFVTANNPKWKAVGAEGSDVDIAQVHSEIADYCWYLSNGKSIYSQVILDTLTKGIGYFIITVDKDADKGKGEVVFKRVDPYDVFVDPMSRDFLFRDASFISIRKNLSKNQLMLLFPEHKTKINKAGEQGYLESYSQKDFDTSSSVQPEDTMIGITPEGEDDVILPYFETYEKVKEIFWNITFQFELSKEQQQQIQEQVRVQITEFTQELEVQLKEKEAQLQQALQSGEIIEDRAKLEMQNAQKMTQQAIAEKQQELMSQAQEAAMVTESKIMSDAEYQVIIKDKRIAKNIVNAIKFYETRVKLTCSVSDNVLLYEYILPYTEYPIVPIPYMYTGTPYPMSAILPLVGKQQEINKAHQIMLHNANLASNLRWMYEEGSVPEEEWEQYSSAPGALLKYRQGFTPPTPVLPAPINNAFYTITQEGKGDAEYISGVPSAMMGFTQDQPETYRGLLANDEFGTRRLKAWMGSVTEPALEHLGKVFMQVAQKHYTIDKVFRIVQPEAGQQEGGEEKEERINIPIYNDYGRVIGKYMDYETARFDVRIVAGATMPINRWALLEEYFRWFQAGLIDDIAMVAETDIRNKEKLLERKSLYSQLQGQLQQLSESLKDKEGTIETLERQLVQAGIKMKIQQGDNEVRKDVLETEAQQKLLRGAMEQEFKAAKDELKLAVQMGKEKAKPDKK